MAPPPVASVASSSRLAPTSPVNHQSSVTGIRAQQQAEYEASLAADREKARKKQEQAAMEAERARNEEARERIEVERLRRKKEEDQAKQESESEEEEEDPAQLKMTVKLEISAKNFTYSMK